MYILRPAKQKYDAFECHNAFWTWILDSGPGLILGYAPLRDRVDCDCWIENLEAVGEGNGRPDDNSGFFVPDSHAMAMADAIQTMTSVAGLNKSFKNPQFLRQAIDLAKWMRGSGGFYIG